MVDTGGNGIAVHPMHFHGHSFRVVAMDKVGVSLTVEDVKQMDKDGWYTERLFI